jgi:hypothetical protein
MDRINALGRGAQIMLVSGVLLFITLFLPWQDFGDLGVDVSFSGWRGIGVILGILTIVLLAWLIVRIASVDIPLPVSTAMSAALIGTLILIFAVIKILTILGDEPTIWAWVGLLLAIAVAFGSFQVVQEAGGVDTLRAEMPAMGSSGSASGSDTAGVPPAAPAAPAATAPPPPTETAPAEPVSEPPAGEAAPGEPADDERTS